jgi:hypothetical protein
MGLVAVVLVGVALFAPACESAEGSKLYGEACQEQTECASGFKCVDGTCLPPSCAECSDIEVCNEAGECLPGFGACSPPCGSGDYCGSSNVCIPDGTCDVDADCASGLVCVGEVCTPGGECGAEEFALTALPPNVMITLDRTGSMDGSVPNSGGLTRFEVASAAISDLLNIYDGTINFGLNLFSACTGNGCAAGTIVEPIGASSAAINTAIGNTNLCFSGDNETVIGGTLDALIGEMSLQDPGRDNIVLLITDGEDNCGGGGDVAAATLLAQPVPVPVYVVGFSGDVDAAELQSIADAANTGQYIQADDANDLNAALQAVASSVASCSYLLGDTPDGQIFVFFDNDPAGVPSSDSNGWSYDAATNTLTFHGATCDQIKSGMVQDIDVVFGCSAPTPD